MTRVCIALSGGVDSAVAAYRLQQEGHEVVAAFLRVWQPDFLPCSQDDDRVAAKRVAAALGIPFFVVDASEAYKRHIVDAMVTSYAKGETPNPDVLCNKIVKFGVLWEWAQKNGCTYIATGHHAQRYEYTTSDGTVRYALGRGKDSAKDQAYFLWELTEDDLSHILFPIGHMQKSEVRACAARAHLPSAARKDSQGLCFLGTLSMHDFLGHLMKDVPGNVLDVQGNVIGTHAGTHLFTLGQRGGFTLTVSPRVPLYVVAVDAPARTITVAEDVTFAARTRIPLRSCVFRGDVSSAHVAEVRYHGEQYPVVGIDARTHVLTLARPAMVSPGQSCVFYDALGVCIGGGVVKSV